ncbi:signal recognition particle protein, partial [Chryseobacterium sp. CH1]
AENAINFAKANGHDVVIVDTAGRLAIDEQMMNEIKSVHYFIKPNETLFVVDSMTGQDAENAINFAKANGHDVVIVDTAGRLAIDEQMMN